MRSGIQPVKLCCTKNRKRNLEVENGSQGTSKGPAHTRDPHSPVKIYARITARKSVTATTHLQKRFLNDRDIYLQLARWTTRVSTQNIPVFVDWESIIDDHCASYAIQPKLHHVTAFRIIHHFPVWGLRVDNWRDKTLLESSLICCTDTK